MEKCTDRNREGYILFVMLIVGAIVFAIALVTYSSLRASLRNAGTRRTDVCAFTIAEAGKEHGIAQLRAKLARPIANGSATILDSVHFGRAECRGEYSVRCSSNAGRDTVWLRSRGSAGGKSAAIGVVCLRYSIFSKLAFTPTAAISSRSAVETFGNITIDGRDWDSTGSRVIGPGLYGVSTCRTFRDQGSASVGGNGNPPVNNGQAAGSVNQLADSTNFPKTPEAVLGVSKGFLDPYIVTSLPTPPFHGIVYLNTNREISFTAYDLAGSSGILIVHDSSNHSGTGTATMREVHGDFKGIIIADKIDHLNSNEYVYGAIVALSEYTSSNIFGNGNPYVRYCSQVLQNLFNYVEESKIKYYVDEISWKEL
jgi:hypothetical protein